MFTRNFNSKIFGVALVPFYAYVLISGFVLVNSHFQFDVFNPVAVVSLTFGLVLSAACYAYKSNVLHIFALCIGLALGGYGVYVGLVLDPYNWMELIASACLIAYNFAMFDMVRKGNEE